MPHIYDNIEASLLPALRNTLSTATRADICVGYLRLRGWDALAPLVETFSGQDDACCRVLVGMQRPPLETVRRLQSARPPDDRLDGPTRRRLLRQVTAHLLDAQIHEALRLADDLVPCMRDNLQGLIANRAERARVLQ